MRKKVILISLYNSNNFTKIIINNINKQLVQPTDVIIINDTRNNNIHQIRSSLNKKIKIKIIENFICIGHCKSLNRGLRYIQTLNKPSIIYRLDKDDVWDNDHIKKNYNILQRTKNILILSNVSSKAKKFFFDKNFIIDNPTIHSSWVINFNLKRNFNYKNLYPEDYATISYYNKLGYKIKYLDLKTVKVTNVPDSLSKRKIANKDFDMISKKNFLYQIKLNNYFAVLIYLIKLLRVLFLRLKSYHK